MADFTLDPIHALPPILPSHSLGGVDLWCFYYGKVFDDDLFRAYEDLMSIDERHRCKSFQFERDRLMFLATRALVRTALSAYVDVPPSAWRFAVGARGKPYISEPPGLSPLHFNLTNTHGLVVCAVSRTYEMVGVDAEEIDRAGEVTGLAESHFSPVEVQALHALPAESRRQRFFRYWTLKESYIKARGLGLALPLEQFSFLLDGNLPIRISFDRRLCDDPLRWRFELQSASSSHIVAVAAATEGRPLGLSASSYVPLRGVIPFEPMAS